MLQGLQNRYRTHKLCPLRASLCIRVNSLYFARWFEKIKKMITVQTNSVKYDTITELPLKATRNAMRVRLEFRERREQLAFFSQGG